MDPTPVMSPAAGTGSPYASHAASGESSRNGAPGSSSAATRSRGKSLPRPWCLLRAAASPPARACASRSFSSSSCTRAACAEALNSADAVFNLDLMTAMALQSGVLQFRFVDVKCLRVEAREQDFLGYRARGDEARALAHGDLHCELERVAVDAAADRGERDGLQTVLEGELQALAVAGGEKLRFSALAAAPHRSHGVDDVLRGQLVAPRDLRLAGRAAAERAAFLQQLAPRLAVDGAVHAAAAQQRRVRRVHDRVHRERRDVDLPGFEPHITIWRRATCRPDRGGRSPRTARRPPRCRGNRTRRARWRRRPRSSTVPSPPGRSTPA